MKSETLLNFKGPDVVHITSVNAENILSCRKSRPSSFGENDKRTFLGNKEEEEASFKRPVLPVLLTIRLSEQTNFVSFQVLC